MMAEKELDYSCLRKILKQAESEMKLPYSERFSLFSNAEAVLESVLSELKEKENNLNYIIRISTILIDNTEEQIEKNKDQSLLIEKFESRVAQMQEEIYELEETLSGKKKVISEQSQTLAQVQEQLDMFTNETHSLKRSKTSKEPLEEIDFIKNIHYSHDQETKRLDGKDYTEAIKARNIKLYRKKSKLNSVKNALTAREDRIVGLEREISSLQNKNRQLASLLKETRKKNTENEELIECLSYSNNQLLNVTKGLESKLQILEKTGKNSFVKSSGCFEENFESFNTLQSELEEFDFYRSEVYECLQLQKLDCLNLKPTGSGKNSGEEFFRMVFFIQTLQTILLSDNYPDHVYRVPHKELYLKAVAQSVPFHNWYPWISTEIKKVQQKRPKN